MADVFVLGAGFSKAIFAEMPLVSELIDPLADHLDQQVAPRYGELLRSLRDLEAVLTGWAEPQPWPLEEERLENLAAFRRAARWLAAEVFGKQQWALGSGAVPGWLAQLVERWHEDRTAVITLNYDSLVESAARTLQETSPSRATEEIYQSLYGEFVPRLDALAGFAVLAGDAADTFLLLKLHGSLNWWYDPHAGEGARPYDADCVDPWNRSDPTRLEDLQGRARGLEPLLVAPVSSKSASLANTWLRRMWVDAHRKLEQAETVYLLGYSMPPADISMRLLIGTSSVCRLVPVNRDPDIVQRLTGLFPSHEIVTQWISDENPIPAFAEAYPVDFKSR